MAWTATASAAENFVHPGCLSTADGLARMAEKVRASEQPWKGSWDLLVANTDGFLDDAPAAKPILYAGSGRNPENFMHLAHDCAKAYQLALRYHGSGDARYAAKAVAILNAWAAAHSAWKGDSNVSLRAGIYGYQLACAAELLRNYQGWAPDDLRKFQNYLRTRFASINLEFLENHHGTVPTHYWANWDLASMASLLAIGVVCDDPSMFRKGVDYFHHGIGNGAIARAVVLIHPDGMGQWQESGRDQGHSLLGVQLMGVVCEIAWNQGVDLYGADNNRFLAGVESISKYNLGHDVPFAPYTRVWGHPGKEKFEKHEQPSPHGRGAIRPGWGMILNHYAGRRSLPAPWTRAYAEKARPEGGGFHCGSNSGGFDSLGFTTLTHGGSR